MSFDRKHAAPVDDSLDEPEIDWPACLDFPVCYAMGKCIDSNDVLTERFSHVTSQVDQNLFWRWREPMTVLDARYMHVELDAMIAELASLESWPDAYRDAVQGLAANSPLTSLLPDTNHFRERLAAARAEAATRTALKRPLRMDGVNDRRPA